MQDDVSRVEDGEGQKETEGRGRERWRKEVCVSVPLRVPRPGPSVGKVAQCLSHDPWGEAVFRLDPWMEMWHHRKPRKGTINISAHPDMHVAAGTETQRLPVYVCLHTLAASTLTVSIIRTFLFSSDSNTSTRLQAARYHLLLLLCYFPTVYLKIWMFVYT